jgi:DNA-binding transcriptional regulator YhcF (GntR family)
MDTQEMARIINSKEMRVKELAEHIGVNASTVQRRLKSAGFVFDKQQEQWVINSEEPASDAAIKSPKASNSKGINKQNSVNASNNKRTKGDNMKAQIQALIKGTKETPEKVYKGVYLDRDIAAFLDNVQHGNRSEIVNRILRQYLTENELL